MRPFLVTRKIILSGATTIAIMPHPTKNVLIDKNATRGWSAKARKHVVKYPLGLWVNVRWVM